MFYALVEYDYLKLSVRANYQNLSPSDDRSINATGFDQIP